MHMHDMGGNRKNNSQQDNGKMEIFQVKTIRFH